MAIFQLPSPAPSVGTSLHYVRGAGDATGQI